MFFYKQILSFPWGMGFFPMFPYSRFSLDFLRFPMFSLGFPMAFPMGFHGGTSAWRPMMMRRRAQPGCASESRQGAEAWSILIGEKVACYQGKMRILQMKLMILGNFDDFAREHYWILMRKMKKMMILQGNMIISLWTMVILPGNVGKIVTLEFYQGKLEILLGKLRF